MQPGARLGARDPRIGSTVAAGSWKGERRSGIRAGFGEFTAFAGGERRAALIATVDGDVIHRLAF